MTLCCLHPEESMNEARARATRTRHDMVDQQTLTNDSFLVATLTLSLVPFYHSYYYILSLSHTNKRASFFSCSLGRMSIFELIELTFCGFFVCDVTVHKKSMRSNVKQHLDCFSIKQKQTLCEWTVVCKHLMEFSWWKCEWHTLASHSMFPLLPWRFWCSFVSFAILNLQLSWTQWPGMDACSSIQADSHIKQQRDTISYRHWKFLCRKTLPTTKQTHQSREQYNNGNNERQ